MSLDIVMDNTLRPILSLHPSDNPNLDMPSSEIKRGPPESVCRQLLLNSDIPNFTQGPIGGADQYPNSVDLEVMIYHVEDHPKIKRILGRAFIVEELNSTTCFIESLKERPNGRRPPSATIKYRLKQNAFYETDSKIAAKINIEVKNFVDVVWDNAEPVGKPRNSDHEGSFRRLDSVLKSLALDSYKLREQESCKEAKRNRVFRSPNDAAWYFEKSLRIWNLDYNHTRPSAELLISFFQSNNINSQAAVKDCVSDFFKDAGRDENYSAVAQCYEGIDFDHGFYLVDCAIFGRKSAIVHCSTNESITPNEKLRAIMSAFLWMRILYPRREWQSRLLKFPFEDNLEEHLHGLVDIKQQEALRDDCELADEDQTHIDWLWSWLSQHDQRPIKLAFLMAKNRMARDVLNEMEVVHRFIEEITDYAQLARRSY
jgi:RNAse (barnase) inhibitor barstar